MSGIIVGAVVHTARDQQVILVSGMAWTSRVKDNRWGSRLYCQGPVGQTSVRDGRWGSRSYCPGFHLGGGRGGGAFAPP